MPNTDPPRVAAVLEALQETLNIAGLTLLVLVSLMIGKWEPLAFGLAAEAVYLALAPRLPAFRHRAASRAAKAGRENFEKEVTDRLRSLNSEDRERAARLDRIRGEILRLNGVSVSESEGGLLGEDLEKMDALYLAYLKLLFLRSEYDAHLARDNPGAVQNEIAKLNAELAAAPSGEVRAMVEKNVEILKKRGEHLAQLGELLKSLEMRLVEIENSFKLVQDQLMEMKAGGDISQNLSSLMADVEATEQMARETGPILSKLQQSSRM